MNIPNTYSELISIIHDKRVEKIKNLKVEEIATFPTNTEIPLEINTWLNLRNLSCIYIDLVNSTEISKIVSTINMAKIYELFTGSLIDYFRSFDAEYIDIKGDGGISIWQGEIGLIKGLVAAISFRTYIEKKLNAFIKNSVSNYAEIKCRTGADYGYTILKRVGLRNRDNKQFNWIIFGGSLITESSLCCKNAEINKFVITNNIFDIINLNSVYKRHLVLSCDHTGNQQLWKPKSINGNSNYKELTSIWCDRCGDDYFWRITNHIKQTENE